MDELHAFVIGAAETFCPWKPRHPMSMDYNNPLKEEYHYYLIGRAAGFIALLCVILLFSWNIKEVL